MKVDSGGGDFRLGDITWKMSILRGEGSLLHDSLVTLNLKSYDAFIFL